MIDWILRFFKGALIGTGFILPGVSGGALAAIFGLYQRIVSFIAHITKNFMANFLFFIPVGLGALFGIFLLARPLSFLLENYEAQVIWGFIGCVILISLFVFILLRCFYIASKANDRYGEFMVAGLSAMIMIHFVENVGMCIGLTPITGIPLPFISYGGTAMITNYIAVGIILSVSVTRDAPGSTA